MKTGITISFAGVERKVDSSRRAEELAECMDGFYRRNASVLSSIEKAKSIARGTERMTGLRSGIDVKTVHGAALYCLGVWCYIAEKETAALRYMKRYLELAEANPSLRLPVAEAKRYRKVIEATVSDPDFKTLRRLVRSAPRKALATIARCEGHAGKDAIVDHMYYVLWAVAAFRTGHARKAYWMSRKAVSLSTRCTLAELTYALISAATFSGARREESIAVLTRLRRRKTSTMLYSPCSVAETKIKRLRHLVNAALRHLHDSSSRLPESLFMADLLRLL